MRHDGGARALPNAVDELDDFRRKPCLEENLDEHRAGAGVFRQTSKPHFADCTARSTSSSLDSGKRPMMSDLSAGFTFSKYSPVDGATHFPAMKFLKSGIGRYRLTLVTCKSTLPGG